MTKKFYPIALLLLALSLAFSDRAYAFDDDDEEESDDDDEE